MALSVFCYGMDGCTSTAGGWLKRAFRLTRSTDFQRVRRMGKSYAHPLIVLVAAQQVVVSRSVTSEEVVTQSATSQEAAVTRVGIVTGKVIGQAVVRNRVKRRLRACVTQTLPHLHPGWDCTLLARKPIVNASYSEICLALRSVIKRAGVWYEPPISS